MKVIITDGGRKAAGFKGAARGDCVARAVAIASGRDYREVYERLSKGKGMQRASKRTSKQKPDASNGVHTKRKWFNDYMTELGFIWTPTMGIGTGCTVHLHDGELPMGRLIVSVSKHLTAVIDGTIHDNHDPQRHTIVSYPGQPDRVSRRCVYGYYKLKD